MIQTKLLEQKIDASGLKRKNIAKRLGMSRYTLLKKINGETEFTASEIIKLSQILHLPKSERDHIFFSS